MEKLASSASAAPQAWWPGAVLVLGDAAVFAYFTLEGLATHSVTPGLPSLSTVLAVAAPVAVPWFVMAWLVGVYRADVRGRLGPALARTALAWLTGGPIGLLARAMLLHEAIIVVVFALVTLGLNLALLLLWHGIAAVALARYRLT